MTERYGYHGVRFSVRGLLATIAFFAVACAALKFANDAWWIALSSVTLVLLMAMAVVALVSEGNQRAFAMGFVVCGLFYGSIVYLSGNKELSCYGDGRLPTSQLLTPIYTAVCQLRYVDGITGEPVSEEVARQAQSNGAGAYGGSGGLRGGGFGGGIRPIHLPQQETFMTIAHLLWALFFGFIGGVFGRFVYAGNDRQSQSFDHSAQHP